MKKIKEEDIPELLRDKKVSEKDIIDSAKEDSEDLLPEERQVQLLEDIKEGITSLGISLDNKNTDLITTISDNQKEMLSVIKKMEEVIIELVKDKKRAIKIEPRNEQWEFTPIRDLTGRIDKIIGKSSAGKKITIH